MTVKQLYEYIEKILPPRYSEEIDTDGAQAMPHPEREVGRVLVALDPYRAAVERAINGGFDVLLTHHPLIYGEAVEGTPPAKWLGELNSAGVAAFSFHLRLDTAKGGVNDILGELLGVRDAVPFGDEEVTDLGRIGTLGEETSLFELAERTSQVLETKSVKYSNCPDKRVRRVAVAGGATTDFIAPAAALGADVLIGGEFKHHAWGYAEGQGIALIEAGHYHTENPVCQRLADIVRTADAGVTVEILDYSPFTAI